MSQRRARNELEISQPSIHRILKDHQWHPYKLQMVQQLLPHDPQSRVNFARNQLNLLAAEPEFFHRIDWSDEAHFHLDGGVNRQDFRYWSAENPHFHTSKALNPPRLTVWAALGSSGVIGPFFFRGINGQTVNVNGQNYLAMLQQFYWPAIQNRPNIGVQIFQQDGAPPHWTLAVRAWLDATFPNRWIGRDSPIMAWPPRSPDLTPMDYFFWGVY
uniref:Transposase n=1 Tax=Panagrolaimus superbus TaxID=310955 RepID=A0A914Z2X2_9BILA